MHRNFARRSALLATASIFAAAAASPTWAADPSLANPDPNIVISDGIDPTASPPAGDLDDTTDVTGVGQVVTDIGGGFIGECTGTLINPRTVILAAHCVNEAPANAYGAATGGIPMSVGFSADNLPGLISWYFGVGGPQYGTNTDLNIYNVEQVWYDTDSQRTGFLEGDVALATLDTPAFNVPTWALLFSPLTSEAHATIVGYGNFGNGTEGGAMNGDFRRRAAENMVSFLGSLQDIDGFLFGVDDGLPQNLYMTDFDDPKTGTPDGSPFDLNLFGGAALPREGTIAPGDSGGPLIIDQKYDRPVVAGVLSGSSGFFKGQPTNSYGTISLYQPLYLFWDQIVANNPYVYANNKAGDANWMDPSHWVQAMDPNYMIDVNGQLVNSLPDTPALGVSGDGAKFGEICVFDIICSDPLTGTVATGDGTPIVIPGGPGSTNFVPNNVVANPALGIRAHYYDVTLSAPGTTSLTSSATIDRLTLRGPTKLDIGKAGTLTVLGDMTQVAGWTNVDGRLNSGESLFVTGILSGSGMIDPTYLTVIDSVVSPGSDSKPSTLTVKGDVILSSGSLLLLDVSHSGADMLHIMGDDDNTGQLLLSGGSLMFNVGGNAPRDGDSFKIAMATGGVDGTFGSVNSIGILQPTLTYDSNDIRAKFTAGKFADYVGKADATVTAFAGALDALRAGSYNKLYGFYGSVDLMSPEGVAATFEGLAPRITSETQSLQDRQSQQMLNSVTGRLSMLGTSQQRGLSVTGTPAAFGYQGRTSDTHSLTDLGMSHRVAAMPSGMSAFIAGGSSGERSLYGGEGAGKGQYSSYMSTGVEYQVADHMTIGSAAGYAEGTSTPGNDQARTKTTQVALYGSYQLGGGAYFGALASAETSKANMLRNVSNGNALVGLSGATHSQRYTAMAEAGVNMGIGSKLTLTPHAQFGYSNYHLDGFREDGGEVALQMDDLRLQKVEARFGAKLTGSASLGHGWAFRPELEANYVRVLSGANDGLAVRFANADDYKFFLPLTNGSSSRAELRGGFKVAKGPLEFGTAVQASKGGGALDDQRATADLTVRF